MTISSAGVGSGLDVNSIVTQLVAIEKQPLQQLQAKAKTFNTQLSLYGTVKSQVSAMGDAAALLAGASGWSAQKATSSDAAAVGVTVGSSATSAALSVEVQQLARAQTSASVGIAAGAAAGATGSLSIELGAWTGTSFSPGAGAPVAVAIDAADTLSVIAGKINAASAGVTATVLKDGSNERLVLRSAATGAEAGFRLNTPADPGLTVLGLSNPSDGVSFIGQTALNAELTVNGVAVTSAFNKIADVIPGVALQLSQVTAAPVEVVVEIDLDAVQKNIQSFVDAYNTVNQTLSDATKYTAATKTGGPLQGDSTTLGLQNALRAMLGSTSTGSTFSYLSDVGIERQTDGSLKINQTKLTDAQLDLTNLKNLFAANNGDPTTNGFGLKVRDFSRALVAFDGAVTNKSTALQASIKRNSEDQDRVTDRAARVEAQLYKQYSALDAQMAQLTGLSSFVTAQLAIWNKSTS
jgi:flagellar hook-associated protein 2